MLANTSWLWIALAALVLLTALSARLAKGGPDAGVNSASRWLLVGLRLAIGWHFLVEGLEKLHSPTWTSEMYLRESTGPLAPYFRALAGDRLVAKLGVGENDAFPNELEVEWRAYFDAFVNFYQLKDDAAQKAAAVFDQEKAKTVTWLTRKQPVQVTATMPPPYLDELTVKERLEHLAVLEGRVREIEADIPRFGKETWKKYKDAKTEVAAWRASLKKDLDQQFQMLKKSLRDSVLLPLLPEIVPAAHRAAVTPPQQDPKKKDDHDKKLKDWEANLPAVYLRIRAEALKGNGETNPLSEQADRIFTYAIVRAPGTATDELLPSMPTRPWRAWTLLDWSDAIVKYGLVVVGGCLLIGLFTRTACVAGAGFLLMFFLAMPPLPGWPENPRAEGHYLYINKNIIEMLALLALATMPSGRWAGIDGLLGILRPSRWRNSAASGSVK